MWYSVAIWPPEIKTGNTANGTRDKHETKEQAQAACEALEREGFGGEGRVFPMSTYVQKA